MMKWFRIVIPFIFSLVLLYLIFNSVDLSSMLQHILKIDTLNFLLFMFFILLEIVLQVIRMDVILGKRYGFMKMFRAYIIGMPVAFLMPSRAVGEFFRIFVFKKILGTGTKESSLAVLTERAFDVAVLVLWSFVFVFAYGKGFHPDYIYMVAAASLIFAAAFYLLYRKYPHKLGQLRSSLTLSSSVRILSLSLMVWFVDFARIFLIFRMLGANVDYLVAGGVAAMSYILSNLSMLPGGIGVFEGFGYVTYAQFGVPDAVALSAIVIERFYSYAIPILLGILAFAGSKLNLREIKKAIGK